jgi:Protein of unknown function (DUF2679).
MEVFKPVRGGSIFYIILIMALSNVFISALTYLVNSYVIMQLFKVAQIILNLYYLYYLIQNLTLTYIINSENIIINSFWGLRKIVIELNAIQGYKIMNSGIKGVKLSGIGNDKFAFGKSVIDKIGTTHMFTSSSKATIYLKTDNISYAISPKNHVEFKQILDEKKINDCIEEFKANKNIDIYKDKSFFIPFILVTIMIIVLTLNPFILYLKNMLPSQMPLNFNAAFAPNSWGTGKQFVFKQMTYGVLNMIILLCMYYASHFCAKYDKKSAYRYIYIAFITALTFLVLQIRILIKFL